MRSSAAGGVNLLSSRKEVSQNFFKSAEGSLVVTSSRTHVMSKRPKSSRRNKKVTASQPETPCLNSKRVAIKKGDAQDPLTIRTSQDDAGF